VERTVLVTFNRPLLQTQQKTLRREISKRRRKLQALQASLERHADQKLRVHALICVLALMVLSLLHRKLDQAGITLSIARMIERLSGIHEVSVLFPTTKGALPRARTVLSDLDEEQHALFEHLNLARFRAA
jgi:hypothetical protein